VTFAAYPPGLGIFQSFTASAMQSAFASPSLFGGATPTATTFPCGPSACLCFFPFDAPPGSPGWTYAVTL